MFVGDAVEEPIDALCAKAGELGLLGVPVFAFQEGHDAGAETALARDRPHHPGGLVPFRSVRRA